MDDSEPAGATRGRFAKVEWWKYLWICPIVTAVAWFCTIFTLLMLWLADGRPVYPSSSNPYVAAISDIGAYEYKPLFVTGATITGVAYALTFIAIYTARYDKRVYSIEDPWHKRVIAFIAVVGALVAGVCLISLSVWDTWRFHPVHDFCLLCTFLGLAVSALCTLWLYLRKPFTDVEALARNRPFCMMCGVVMVVEVPLAIGFYWCLLTGHMIAAGVGEWVLTFIGVAYILSLVGFTLPPKHRMVDETTPLIDPLPVL